MDGIFLLDKPQNITSFGCCAMARRLLGEKKIGHAGTLDPMATGVLPLLVGKATRALELLPCHDKRYSATLRFGYTSDTLDMWGKVVPTGGRIPEIGDVEAAIGEFRGDILQIPPMMSAIKKDGIRLYELARRGEEIVREARPVTIHLLNITGYDSKTGELSLDCHCSKGTYIRTLCDDLGCVLRCGAVMIALRRTEAAGFIDAECITPEHAAGLAESGCLGERVLPVEQVFMPYPAITVTEAQTARFRNGGALSLERLSDEVSGITRVHAPDGKFVGLGQPNGEELKILRLF